MVLAEVEQRANALVQKSAGLTQDQAIRKVFAEDPALYQHYRETSMQPRPQIWLQKREEPLLSAVEIEIEQRANALVRKGSATTRMDAVREVLNSDRTLYGRYRQVSAGRAPEATGLAKADTPLTFSEALVGAKSHEIMGDQGDHLAALQGTLMRILTSDTADKAALARQAINDFTTASGARLEAWLRPEATINKSSGRVQRLRVVQDLLQRVLAV